MTELQLFTWFGIGAAGLLFVVSLTVLLVPLPLPNLDWLKGSLLAYLGILPLFVMLLATTVTYNSSKSVDFCASCHIMQSHIDNVRDPSSEALASLHFKNRYIQKDQCFTCHTDYALFGDERTKIAGLRHVYAWAFKEVKEPLKLYRPYNTANCLHCHGESQKFLKAGTHQDILQELKDRTTSCLDCHGPAHANVGKEEE